MTKTSLDLGRSIKEDTIRQCGYPVQNFRIAFVWNFEFGSL